MNEQKVRETFYREQRELGIERSKVALKYMATPLVLGFSAIDFFFRPDLLYHFFCYRLLVIPFAAICYSLFSIRLVRERQYAIPAFLFTFFLGVLNSYMAMKTGAETSPYYAGLNLVGVGALAFLPLGFRSDVICACCIYLPYFAMLPIYSKNVRIDILVPHSAFMFSTMFLGVIAKYYFRRISFREVKSRLALEHEMHNKEEVIAKKTQEGVYLESLTRQFSPQVIEAIKTGDVSISKATRREVTIIFIDSESSTTRATRIDHDEYLDVIKDFYTRCSDIFIKHDITTGTFLGDGLMAFANAPKNNKLHQQIAVKACLEILEMRSEMEKYYQDKWKNKFSIRIGINTGFVQVGFFPSQERGTYTVIGAAANLSSRLCSVSEANTIAVTKSFLRNVADDLSGVDIRKLESRNLKGLEGELIELFSISAKANSDFAHLGSCRLCHGAMAISSDFGDTILIKCTNCNRYTDILEKKVYLEFMEKGAGKAAA